MLIYVGSSLSRFLPPTPSIISLYAPGVALTLRPGASDLL